MYHAIRATPSSSASLPTIWRPFSPPLTPIPMPHPSARPVGAPDPVPRARGRVSGAPPRRGQRRPPLHLHAPVVGQDDWDSALAGGTPGEAGRLGAAAARPPGALWRLSSTAQPPARSDDPHAAPTGRGGTRGQHGIAALERGTAAEARLSGGQSALPLVSAGDAADHCRHDAGRGDPDDPPAPEVRGGPTPHCSRACPPGSLGVVLGLPVASHAAHVRRDGPQRASTLRGA